MKTVYIETSIFSFFYDERTSADVVAMRQWTRDWWTRKRNQFELVTSTPVLIELDKGSMPHREKALAMAKELPYRATDRRTAVRVACRLVSDRPQGDAKDCCWLLATCNGGRHAGCLGTVGP